MHSKIVEQNKYIEEKEVEFNEINHAISEIKYYSEKHIHIDYLFCIYQTLCVSRLQKDKVKETKR